MKLGSFGILNWTEKNKKFTRSQLYEYVHPIHDDTFLHSDIAAIEIEPIQIKAYIYPVFVDK